MAGGHGSLLKSDAIERWGAMRENVYQNFKFTKKTTRQTMIWAITVPALVLVLTMQQYAKYDWAGKQRGSSLLANTPRAPETKVKRFEE